MSHRMQRQSHNYQPYPTTSYPQHHYADEGTSDYNVETVDDDAFYYQESSSPPPPPPPMRSSSRDGLNSRSPASSKQQSPSSTHGHHRKRMSGTTTTTTNNTTSSSKQPIKLSVCVRMRPTINEDYKHATTKRNAPEICVHFRNDGQTIKLIQDQHHFKQYKVDHTFDTSYGQKEVYNVALKPIVKDVIKGYNGTCMVYGQTASGKTYTMFGSDNQFGIAHLAVHDLFEAVRQFEDDDLVAKVFISFYQIYLENIYDLLGDIGYGFDSRAPTSSSATLGGGNEAGPNWNTMGGFGPSATLALDMKQQNTLPSLNIREDSERGIYVENLHYCFAKDCSNAFELISQGLQRRKVNSTAYNVKSSRSHAILQIYCDFEERSNEPPLHGQSEIKYGPQGSQYQHSGHLIEKKYVVRRRTLTLVDLAGSERVQTFKQSTKKQLQEASMINKSIAALGNCIYALSNREQQQQFQQQQPFNNNNVHIPYRDCKLTRLLSESLGGNAKTTIIATISPCLYNYEETSSTLKFASRAKVIRKVVKRAKIEEIVVESKVLNYFQPFPDQHGTDEEHNVYRDDDAGNMNVGTLTDEDIDKMYADPLDVEGEKLNVLHDVDDHESQVQERYHHHRHKNKTHSNSHALLQHRHPEDNFMNELTDDAYSRDSRASSRHATPQRARSNSATRPPRPPITPNNGTKTGSGPFTFQPYNPSSGASVASSSIQSSFSLRDFLRACTIANKVADPNATTDYELGSYAPSSTPASPGADSMGSLNAINHTTSGPPLLIHSSERGSFPVPPAINIPDNNEMNRKVRRPSSATVMSDTSDILSLSTAAQTPRAGYSSIPSKIDDDPMDEDQTGDHPERNDSGSPFPFYNSKDNGSPRNNNKRRPSIASAFTATSNISGLSLEPVGESNHSPNRTPVAVSKQSHTQPGRKSPKSTSNSPSDNHSVSTMGSITTPTHKGSRSRSSKGVQTWSIIPELPTQKYDGSLDDFGNYAHSTKVDQSTQIDHDILFETSSAGTARSEDKAEFSGLMKMPAYDLAVAIFKLRDSLKTSEENNKLLTELLLESMGTQNNGATRTPSLDSILLPHLGSSSSFK